jgi:hypothetical protein
LDAATRLIKTSTSFSQALDDLIREVLHEAGVSLESFSHSQPLDRPASRRLPFRELGLGIGLQGLRLVSQTVSQRTQLKKVVDEVLSFQVLADQIQEFWSAGEHRKLSSWLDHEDINTVMLATCLAPQGYYRF